MRVAKKPQERRLGRAARILLDSGGEVGRTLAGRYEIVRRLGEGAMAAVYEARDRQLDRRVAVKILSDALRSEGKLLERFHREALIVARLRHANLATVYDVGEDDGTPYIAMELVEGRTLAELFADHELSLRARVVLLAKVADALHYAHTQGVVHRDLKPQNILVDKGGEPRVVDFGLAHVMEGGGTLTRSGAVLGTPLYMSPEQVRGGKKIDARSDVWSLGVILYEGLVGRVPFTADRLETLYRLILLEEPRALRSLVRTLPADLETVCLKALEKEPGRRYVSARALAEDLRRWLGGEPIAARPPSVALRLRRLVRRRPFAAAMALAVLVGAAVIGGMVVVQRGSARAAAREEARRQWEAAQELAGVHCEAAIEPLIRADQSARQAGDEELVYAINRRLGEVALENRDFGLARVAFAACEAIRPGEALVGKVEERRGAEKRERKERITAALEDLRAGLRRRGRPANAPVLDDYVFEIARYDDEQTVAMLAEALAPLESRESYTQEESELMTFAFRVLGRLGRPSVVGPLGRMMAVLAEKRQDDQLAIECGIALANTRRPEAHEILVAARERFNPNSQVWGQVSRIFGRVETPVGDEPRSAADFMNRGLVRRDKGDLDGAIEDYSRAIELDPRDASAFNNRGLARYGKGDLDGAIEDYSRAIEIDPRYAIAFSNRGIARRRKGDPDGAIEDYSRAIELDPGNAGAFTNRGNARRDKGDLEGAIEDYSRAIEIDPGNAMTFNNRGNARRDKGNLEGAIEDYSCAIELDPGEAMAFSNRGNARRDKGDLEGAIEDYSRAIEIDPRDAIVFTNRGIARYDKGDLAGAIKDHSCAIEIDPRDAIAFTSRGIARYDKGDLEGAIDDYSRAIELHPRDAIAFSNRGTARRDKGDLEGAIKDYSCAIEIDPRNAPAFTNRGIARYDKGDLEGAIEDHSRAIKIDPRNAIAFSNRGNARGKKGDLEGAIEDHSCAIEIDPRDAIAFTNRGIARYDKGDLSGAIADWERFLELAPNHPNAPAVREAIRAARRE